MSEIIFIFEDTLCKIIDIRGVATIDGDAYLEVIVSLAKSIEGISAYGFTLKPRMYTKEEIIKEAKNELRKKIRKRRREREKLEKWEEKKKMVEQLAEKLNKKLFGN